MAGELYVLQKMKIYRILLSIFTCILLAPFFVNIFGSNIVYQSFIGVSSVMVEAQNGLCRISYHGGYTSYSMNDDEGTSTGVVVINNDSTIFEGEESGLYLVNRSESMTPFVIRSFKDERGSNFEFPWLFLLVIPLALFLAPSVFARLFLYF
ncbi:hypothetical protein HW115_19520 [Verrucomicrobiaceae bacterium N1E253]|uniref:Uncharacterized protein n=1 Tax=Oceaniferula marina TaxID=2748318 RepID=A0A851GJ29_9BACT|nr:hypothetical protein [Oceaniferula marina]NWK57818.1 hypothetical protein [Oceaniferula marina]